MLKLIFGRNGGSLPLESKNIMGFTRGGLNIRLGRETQTLTNTLAYFSVILVTSVKRFYSTDPTVLVLSSGDRKDKNMSEVIRLVAIYLFHRGTAVCSC
jgi:hypothetical protein